jgi:MFS family permease
VKRSPSGTFTLGRQGGFWVAASVAGVALWTSGAPSLTYPLYAAQWHLSTAVTTSIFAVYPVVLVTVLIVAGDLSDVIGRRAAILYGLTASLIGSVLFAVAPDVGWVFAGRAFMGVGVGLAMSAATAAMVELSPVGHSERASSIATAATALGLVLATLVGGALIQYAPFPTHLNFWVLTGVVATVLVSAWQLPRHVPAGDSRPWRPRTPRIPTGLRGLVAISASAVTAAYTCGAVLLSLGADIAKSLIGSSNTLVNGSAISLSAAVIGTVALAARKIPARRAIALGAPTTTVGMALLMLSASDHSLVVFLAAAVASGIGYSLLFLGGLTLINTHAPAHHRGGTLSAVYLFAYLGQGVIAIALGLIATASDLRFAVDLGAPVIIFLSLLALVLAGTLHTDSALTHNNPLETS